MSNTANNLARDVGLELGIIDAVTDLSDDELEDLTNLSRQVHEELRIEKACYWDEDDIPDGVYRPLVRYLAACGAKTFGKKVEDSGLDEARTREVRLERLKTLAKERYSGAKLKSDFPSRRRYPFSFTQGW
jgi:hypothetical protein